MRGTVLETALYITDVPGREIVVIHVHQHCVLIHWTHWLMLYITLQSFVAMQNEVKHSVSDLVAFDSW